MSDLTRYRYDDGGDDPDSWGESPEAYLHRKWLENHNYLVPDDSLQQIADAWNEYRLLDYNNYDETEAELEAKDKVFALLDGLVNDE